MQLILKSHPIRDRTVSRSKGGSSVCLEVPGKASSQSEHVGWRIQMAICFCPTRNRGSKPQLGEYPDSIVSNKKLQIGRVLFAR
jgi:hypothetical protein